MARKSDLERLFLGNIWGRWLHMLVWIGLFGLVVSFHGIIMGYSRQLFALSSAGFLPPVLARLHPRRKTPHWAILCGGVIGIVAIYSDQLLSFGAASDREYRDAVGVRCHRDVHREHVESVSPAQVRARSRTAVRSAVR